MVGRLPARAHRQEVGRSVRRQPGLSHRHGARHGELGQLRGDRLLVGAGRHRRHLHRQGHRPGVRLPAGKIPTAVSVTNKNEFALITVVDVEKKKGQVAVVALQAAARRTASPTNGPTTTPACPTWRC